MRLALETVGLWTGVRTRNRRSPGFRVLGLRRVEVATGGPVGVRAAAIRVVVTQGRKAVLDAVFASLRRRSAAHRRDLAPELMRLQEQHGDDRDALERASRELFREANVKPFSSVVWVLGRLLATYATDL